MITLTHISTLKKVCLPYIVTLTIMSCCFLKNPGSHDGDNQNEEDFGKDGNYSLVSLLSDASEDVQSRVQFAMERLQQEQANVSLKCTIEKNGDNWDACMEDRFNKFDSFISRNCDGCPDISTESGRLYELSQCPPVYLLDTLKQCGGDEYDVTIARSASPEDQLELESLDLENGLYVFRLPEWAEEIPAILSPRPVLIVRLVFTRCQGMLFPPEKNSDYVHMTHMEVEVAPLNCEPFTQRARSASRGPSPLNALLGGKKRSILFLGDSMIMGLQEQIPELFRTRGSYNLGQPMSSVKVQVGLGKLRARISDTVVLMSNTLEDIRSIKHEDGFRAHAQELDAVLRLLIKNFSRQNIVLLTGPRMLPHRMDCPEIANDADREACWGQIDFVSDSKMSLLNEIYRTLSVKHGVHLVDANRITWTFMRWRFAWKEGWTIKEGVLQDLWKFISLKMGVANF